MRKVSINTKKAGTIMAYLKPSTKEFINIGNNKIGCNAGEPIDNDEITSVNVILDSKLQEIEPSKYWSYDAIINVLGSDD